VLGGGSAGFLAALALRSRLPELDITVIRSREIGIIGVGEGSTPSLTRFLHEYLAVDPKSFFELAQPTWKLGIRFLWGPRPYFNYNFNTGQLASPVPGLRRLRAAYAAEDMEYEDPISALMSLDRAFERNAQGLPVFHPNVAYHFENEKFVGFLERLAVSQGVAIVEDTVTKVDLDETGAIAALHMASGENRTAGLYLDASGFESRLLRKALGEPFLSYGGSLFCDRAIIGGWDRTVPEEEVIRPYTTCETMNAGWCWRIEHERRVHRGYVYCSSFASDHEAEAEFRAKNPKASHTRVIPFVSGRYRHQWVKNVVAIGNAGGFVEPLEATALGAIAFQSRTLTDTLLECNRRPTPLIARYFNELHGAVWDDIRNFLALHYRYNTRLDTPFWRHCQQATDLAGAAEVVELYRHQGPSVWIEAATHRASQFGVPGYLALLVGLRLETQCRYQPSGEERRLWQAERDKLKGMASRGLTVNEALAIIRMPQWRWGAPKRTSPA